MHGVLFIRKQCTRKKQGTRSIDDGDHLNNDGLPLGVRGPRSVESSNEVRGLLVHVRRAEPAAAVVVARPDLPRVPRLPLGGCGFLIISSFSPRPPKAEAAEGHGRRALLATHGASSSRTAAACSFPALICLDLQGRHASPWRNL